jgi:hypothetical protein
MIVTLENKPPHGGPKQCDACYRKVPKARHAGASVTSTTSLRICGRLLKSTAAIADFAQSNRLDTRARAGGQQTNNTDHCGRFMGEWFGPDAVISLNLPILRDFYRTKPSTEYAVSNGTQLVMVPSEVLGE